MRCSIWTVFYSTPKRYTPKITQEIVSKYGKTYDWSIKANMIGRKAIDSARYLVSALSLPITAEQYLENRNDRLIEEFYNAKALPGAERLIRHLHANGIPIALATSSTRELFEIKASSHQEWFSLFDTVVTGDHPDVINGKPAPDIFNIAANNINATPSSTLVFEDAPSGLEAGIAANMRVIVVPDPNMDKGRYVGADLIIDSLLEFDPAEYQMAPMKPQ